MLSAFCFYADSARAMTAHELSQKVEDRYTGKTSKAQSIMILKGDKQATRKRKLLVIKRKTDNKNRSLFIHFLSPADIRNTTYLVLERDHKWDEFRRGFSLRICGGFYSLCKVLKPLLHFVLQVFRFVLCQVR
jgi:hypothetical protein